ncbi:hypothetical protein [Oceanobacillus sp. CFH 90083]|uniref:hypothetical protein n=1 Tax=Oceanobacillus sp. CFH 90083 TaxID=2592336 RepID=UPI001D1441B8|nr:hypothetical protein [Oceanobacillus sp. CFH 90083]
MNEKLPPVLEDLRVINDNKELLFGKLHEEGYITEEQKEVIIEETEVIYTLLGDSEKTIADNQSYRDAIGSGAGDPRGAFGVDAGSFLNVRSYYSDLMDSLERMKKTGIMDNLHIIMNSHSLPEMLSAMPRGNKSYISTDMVLSSTEGGK